MVLLIAVVVYGPPVALVTTIAIGLMRMVT